MITSKLRSWAGRGSCGCLLVALMAAGLYAAPPTGEAPPLPADWLCLAATADATRLLEASQALLEEFGRPEAGVVAAARPIAQLFLAAQRPGPLIVGLRATRQGGPSPFALAPIKDFEAFASSLGAELAGDAALLTVGVSEFEVFHQGGWALIVPAGAAPDLQPLKQAEANAPENGVTSWKSLEASLDGSDLVIAVAKAGVERGLAEAVAIGKETPPALLRQQLRLGRGGSWLSPAGLRALAGAGLPVLKAIERSASGMLLSIDLGQEAEQSAGPRAVLKVALRDPDAADTNSAFVAEPPAVRPLLFNLPLPQSGAAKRLAADLYLGYVESTPWSVGLSQYPPGFDPFRSAVFEAMGAMEGGSVVAIMGGDGAPIAANQFLLVRASKPQALQAAFVRAIESWNAMLAAPGGDKHLVFQADPILKEDLKGTRYLAEVVDPAELDRVPEVKQVMSRFYGPTCKASLTLADAGDGLMVLADLTEPDLAKTLDGLAPAQAPTPTKGDSLGSVFVDRLLNYRRVVQAEEMSGAIGWKPGPEFPQTPPCEVTLNEAGGTLELGMTIPRRLIEAYAESLKPAPPRDADR